MLSNEMAPSPLEEVCVALDLETTGLDLQRDEIIEVGAARFRGERVLETFRALVNPGRPLSPFIVQLTGITQGEVAAGPSFGEVAGALSQFLGPHPVVGHNVGFDLAFLARAGLGLANGRYDTHEMASVFVPSSRGYGLSDVAQALGLAPRRRHRALEDALACQEVFVLLVRRALELPPGVLVAMSTIAGRSPWPLQGLLRGLAGAAVARQGERGRGPGEVGILGLDAERLRQALRTPRPVRTPSPPEPAGEEAVAAMLMEGGAVGKGFPNYEEREQQIEMAKAVAGALNLGGHLVVEAGTGVGKSLAYLLPAMLLSMRDRQRVVISTNTINLQEQLTTKDIPALRQALAGQQEAGLEEFRFAVLKGRSNYLCSRRWAQLAQSPGLSAEEARMVAKTLVWLQETVTGDRGELTIPSRDGALWERLSAQGAGECDGHRGMCFLRAARGRAEGAHVVVVNHALLLSDLARGGGLLPAYDHVVIDEAHHLEAEATRQLGYAVPSRGVEELASQLSRRLQDVRFGLRPSQRQGPMGERREERLREVEGAIPRAREAWGRLSRALADFVAMHAEGEGPRDQIRVTRSSRKQPGWSNVEVLWEEFHALLGEVMRSVERLAPALEPDGEGPLAEALGELEAWREKAEEVQSRVEEFVIRPQEECVYWMALSGQDGEPTLNAAPLNVGPKLKEMLFSKKRSVVLTSATLSVQGSTKYLRERVGLEEARDLVLGSPFDYQKAALLLVAKDMPEPSEPGYQAGLEEALVRVARASGGGVMGLFTAHASVQATRRGIKALLESEGFQVLAQGVDGSPRQLVDAASGQAKSVLLGTSSLWEGVDLPGDLLRVLVVARLPFDVPTDPLFAARAERFSDPFNQYALPQAVLRFRQGFGRLIRSSSDRGVAVVLDRRVLSRAYGSAFLRSIPRCTEKRVSVLGLEEEVAAWLTNGLARGSSP